MEVSLTTPSILFPAISLLMLAYTNRFLALANVIRMLSQRYRAEGSSVVKRQLENLRRRIMLIRWMQALGISSLIACTCSVSVMLLGFKQLGGILFAVSLLLMLISLLLCLREITLSGRALEIELEDMEK